MEIIKIPKKEGIIDRRTGRIVNRKLRVAEYAFTLDSNIL